MSQTLIKMATELVTEQVRIHHLPPEEANVLLQTTHATLRNLHQTEMTGPEPAGLQAQAESVPGDWRQSIAKHAIICLVCGGSFRQLSSRHLRTHNLDPQSYRMKYGIPSTQPLSSRNATARRRQLAHEIRPWEGASSKRQAARASAKNRT